MSASGTPFTDSRREPTDPAASLRELDLVGDDRERGRQHGLELRAEIHDLYSNWLACARRQPQPIGESELLDFVGSHVERARDYAPHAVREVEGIAEGSGLRFDRTFALSCWDELCSWFSSRADAAPVAGCTSFAVGPRAKQRVIIGQNQDASGWWRPVIVLRAHDPAGRWPDALVASHPGVLGTLGVNACGVGVVANSLLPRDRSVGVPFTVVMREALRQATLADAIAAVVDAPRAGGANYVIATCEGAVDVEASHRESHVEEVNGRFAHSNHYFSGRLAALDVGGHLLPDSYLRVERMSALLAEADDEITVERSLEMLSDHKGAPTAVCRHPPADVDDMETLTASVIVPTERALYMTDGPPCSSHAQRFKLVPSDCTSWRSGSRVGSSL